MQNNLKDSDRKPVSQRVVFTIIILLVTMVIVTGCKKHTPEDGQYIKSIEEQRSKKDIEMKTSPESPFLRDKEAHFSPLKYYDVDPSFVYKSVLALYGRQDTVLTYGTKGDERKAIKIGYVGFIRDNKKYRLNVYKSFSRSGQEFYSVWFTDRTSGNETYGVGRYLDFELNPDPGFIYTIDFNLAYNPFCSYSSLYSCSIPTKDDFLDLAITAGEKKFHE